MIKYKVSPKQESIEGIIDYRINRLVREDIRPNNFWLMVPIAIGTTGAVRSGRCPLDLY